MSKTKKESVWFKEKELKCKCGCGLNNVDSRALNMLDFARDISGIPFKLNSACRCYQHNKNVGGVVDSSHRGDKKPSTAFDVRVHDNKDRFKILMGLIKAGFTRIVIYKSFIHADFDQTKTQDICVLQVS